MNYRWKHISRTAVRSELIASIGYDAAHNMLQVAFINGGVYNYFDVPPYLFDDMMHADSKGSFYNRHIKHHYDYELFIDHKKAG